MPTIVLGVSGSIAAYKAADLASRLVKAGYEVYPVLTRGAAEFITPVTFRALTGRPCPVDLFEEPFPGEIAHIHLARIADLFAIVPASMDFIARLAHGLGNDMLSAAALATKSPVLLAPGMNTGMWENPATQANLESLASFGYRFIEPVSGRLACRTEGVGKMADVSVIFDAIQQALSEQSAWAGKRVLVTAGPTREPIDPVRYISNRSSGKMGYAIAEAAARQGAQVTLISGPVAIPPLAQPNVSHIRVTTATDMHRAALAAFSDADVIFAAAAVADYRPSVTSVAKIKKTDSDTILSLTRTPDILAEMGRAKRDGQLLVGFAAETDDVESNARKKLDAKGLDYVVANDVSRDDAGFDVDTNAVTVLGHDTRVELPLMSKREVALRLLDFVRSRLA